MRAALLALALFGCGGRERTALDGDWLISEYLGGLHICDGTMRAHGAVATLKCGGDSGPVAVKWDGSLRVELEVDAGAAKGRKLTGYSDGSLLEADDGFALVLAAQRADVRWGKVLGAPQPDTCDGCAPKKVEP